MKTTNKTESKMKLTHEQELKKSDRIPTFLYHDEIKEARRDFINHLKNYSRKKS